MMKKQSKKKDVVQEYISSKISQRTSPLSNSEVLTLKTSELIN